MNEDQKQMGIKPDALFCMIVTLSEGKQGSDPNGDEFLLSTGRLLFVLKAVRVDLRPQGADFRS